MQSYYVEFSEKIEFKRNEKQKSEILSKVNIDVNVLKDIKPKVSRDY